MNSRIDPDIEKLLPLLPLKDPASLTVKRARDEMIALTDARKDVPLPEVSAVEDIAIEGVAGTIPARLYRGSTSSSATVVYFHGGGWLGGNLYTHERQARQLAIELDAVVLSVDYRQPPEVRFPGAFEDCLAATRWAAKNTDRLGADAGRLAIAGDSAGGQLAASVALSCRETGPQLNGQFLIYPAIDVAGAYKSQADNAKYPSRRTNAEGYFLTTATMAFFASQYLRSPKDALDPRLSPLHAADLKGLPPAVICTAEFDPLRDEGEAYAKALQLAGVRVAYFREAGMIHGFFGMGGASAAAESTRRRASATFKALLG
jgi:acetyl esterase